MRIVQIDRHDLSLNFILELVGALVLLAPLGVKAVLSVVLPWGWLGLDLLNLLLVMNSPLRLREEDLLAALHMFLDGLRVVLPDTRVLLFKVNVDCYRLDIVQGVVFIEGQTEVAFVVHLGGLDVLLRPGRVVVPRPHLDFGVAVKHLGCGHEAFGFIVKLLLDDMAVEVLQPLHFGPERRLDRASRFRVSPRPSVSVEVLFQLQLAVKAHVFRVEGRHLLALGVVDEACESIGALTLLHPRLGEGLLK